MNAFNRYAPFIQDFIYSHDWESLRSIQVAAADAIFNTQDNVLLTASTASGKTEAAFFPILTEFWENPPASVGALYIGPLKALINDQFVRLNDLCEEADIPVWHWHGDVSQSHKAKLIKKPSGILQITPESLEALLIHKHMAIPRMFCDLRYVVIDEVHSLMRATAAGRRSVLSSASRAWQACSPAALAFRPPSATPSARVPFSRRERGATALSPVLRNRVACGVSPWSTSTTRVPRHSSGNSRAWVLKRPKCLRASASRRRHPRHCRRAQDMRHSGQLTQEERRQHRERTRGKATPKDRRTSSAPEGEVDIPQATEQALLNPTDTAPDNADPGMGYIFEHTRGRKCLVFANSREEAEAVCSMLRSYCESRHEPDRFLIHHGNLSASLRETAEELMRDEEQAQTTVTTSTLELGIDIGRLERAFQIDAPFTVSSFLQRMGRTGRRDLPPEMWFVMREEEPEPRTMMPETIPWKLLQGIALVQLYREEKWVEPPELDRLPYSLLYHQTMSTLASTGELTPAELAQRVLTLSYFHRVSADDYRVLLRHLIKIDHIQVTEGGGLIVGLAGERIINNFKFYAVFQENEEFTVRSESAELGTIINPPPPGERIAIAGHCWIVEEVDWKRHTVFATQVKGRVPAYFGDCPGDINTHVLERMRKALNEHAAYPYLMGNARARLAQARHTAEISGAGTKPLINLGGDTWVLFPWLGSYAFLALERMLKIKCAAELGLRGLDPSRPYFMQFKMKADEETFFEVLAAEAEKDFDPIELVYPGEVPYFDRYDEYVPEELVRKGFAEGVLDIEGMKQRVLSWRDHA